MEIDFLEENDIFKMQIPLDRHSPIIMPNDCQLPNPSYFPLPSTFNIDLETILKNAVSGGYKFENEKPSRKK
jgi:hypothetical protein